MTPDDFAELLAQNDGLCVSCNEREGKVVDHDHQTGKVRGILCSGCNTAAGMLADKPAYATRLAGYLAPH